MYKLEMKNFAGSTTHQFTGGANLISAVLVLAIMILPTVINISEASLRAVLKHLKAHRWRSVQRISRRFSK